MPSSPFIADGRRDPYGKKVIPEGGAHMKTLHLKPFWAGVQKGQDALGLVVYRQQDILPTNPTLESHLVLPTGVDEILLNDEPIQLHRGQPPTRPLKPADIRFCLVATRTDRIVFLATFFATDFCTGLTSALASGFSMSTSSTVKISVSYGLMSRPAPLSP